MWDLFALLWLLLHAYAHTSPDQINADANLINAYAHAGFVWWLWHRRR
jgi:hypothetical protein